MSTTLKDWIGHDLVDDSGSKIGRITQVYVDATSGEPEWLAVSTGLFGTRSSFVPLQGLHADDDVLVSPWSKDMVKDAPNVEDDGDLTADEEQRLYGHYETSSTPDGKGSGAGGAAQEAGSVTRSEEQLKVDTTSEQVGTARLRKWVETEHQTVTVPVRKEKVRVERETLDGRPMADGEIGEDDQEITLSEERVTVDTEVVAKEKVTLGKEVETEDRQVEADVQKERVEVDGAD